MIKLILSGGLGNQMFQYAAARSLSLKLQTDMSVDLYALFKRSDAIARNYELDAFAAQPKVDTSIITKMIVKGFGYWKGNTVREYFMSCFNVFRDTMSQMYDDRFSNLTSDTILFGYFQNEKYFQNFESIIRQDFTFKQELDFRNEEVKVGIKKSNSVSIHIRRGDYLAANSNLVVLDIQYYKKAIEYIKLNIDNPSFFIFSDDIEWVKSNIDLGQSQHLFIDWNKGDNSYIDMHLMSVCKHNIIANSSFSWWGAWLNKNPDKRVVAPSVWYNKYQEKEYPPGFIPNAWVII